MNTQAWHYFYPWEHLKTVFKSNWASEATWCDYSIRERIMSLYAFLAERRTRFKDYPNRLYYLDGSFPISEEHQENTSPITIKIEHTFETGSDLEVNTTMSIIQNSVIDNVCHFKAYVEIPRTNGLNEKTVKNFNLYKVTGYDEEEEPIFSKIGSIVGTKSNFCNHASSWFYTKSQETDLKQIFYDCKTFIWTPYHSYKKIMIINDKNDPTANTRASQDYAWNHFLDEYADDNNGQPVSLFYFFNYLKDWLVFSDSKQYAVGECGGNNYGMRTGGTAVALVNVPRSYKDPIPEGEDEEPTYTITTYSSPALNPTYTTDYIIPAGRSSHTIPLEAGGSPGHSFKGCEDDTIFKMQVPVGGVCLEEIRLITPTKRLILPLAYENSLVFKKSISASISNNYWDPTIEPNGEYVDLTADPIVSNITGENVFEITLTQTTPWIALKIPTNSDPDYTVFHYQEGSRNGFGITLDMGANSLKDTDTVYDEMTFTN